MATRWSCRNVAIGSQPLGRRRVKEALGCLKCHAPDKEVVGPAYKAVSAKFNKDSAKLIAAFEKVEDHGKVKKKSSKEDLENIAAWIFTL